MKTIEYGIRSLFKNKLYTLINIVGLSIGLASALIIVNYISHESSYDNYHKDGDSVYRIVMDRISEGEHNQFALSYYATSETLKDEYPNVQAYVKTSLNLSEQGFCETEITSGRKNLRPGKMYYATGGFFEVFDYPRIDGDWSKSLSEPNTAVISKDFALQLFETEDAIGKTFVWSSSDHSYEITGIIDVPENSHFKFDLLLSFENFDLITTAHEDPWKWFGFYHYIKLDNSIPSERFAIEIANLYEKYTGISSNDPNHTIFTLQPLKSIHLHSNLGYEHEINGDINTLHYLGIASGMIMLLAFLNYINLATSTSVIRAKEVGLKKILGSSTGALRFQFLLESITVSLLSLILSLPLAIYFNKYIEAEILFPPLNIIYDPQFIALLTGAVVVSGIVAGLYPAIVLSSLDNKALIQGKMLSSKRGIQLRRVLVVFQFVIAGVLVTASLIVNNQLNFMINSELGYDSQKIIVLKAPSDNYDQFLNSIKSFRSELESTSLVKNVSSSSTVPGQIAWSVGGVRKVGNRIDEGHQFMRMLADAEYVDLYDIKILHGRNFNPSLESDSLCVMISEEAARQLGFQKTVDVLNENIIVNTDTSRVVGVFQDYHHMSLKDKIEPLILQNKQEALYFVSVNMATVNPSESIAILRQKWSKFFPTDPFEYTFLDDSFQKQYKQESDLRIVMFLFTGLTMTVAMIGILGLASFLISQRKQEIAIRKVLGAKVSDLFRVLVSEYLTLIAISFIIFIPLTYFVTNDWVSKFAYKSNISILLYLFPLVILSASTFLTIGYRIFRATQQSPTSTLRDQ